METLYKQFCNDLRHANENDTVLFAQMRTAYEKIIKKEDEERLNMIVN